VSTSPRGLIAALHAEAPASSALHLYQFLVGDWETEIVAHAPGGATHIGRGEIHAGWVLEGRAIQDVWTIARRPGEAMFPVAGNWYGTTLRVHDPRVEAWHIFWIDPATQFYARQLGRADGAGIVQEGTSETGVAMRWSFRDIERDSFRWRGEARPEGQWLLQVEVTARRYQAR
jgi:hypothetical protein